MLWKMVAAGLVLLSIGIFLYLQRVAGALATATARLEELEGSEAPCKDPCGGGDDDAGGLPTQPQLGAGNWAIVAVDFSGSSPTETLVGLWLEYRNSASPPTIVDIWMVHDGVEIPDWEQLANKHAVKFKGWTPGYGQNPPPGCPSSGQVDASTLTARKTQAQCLYNQWISENNLNSADLDTKEFFRLNERLAW